MLAAPPAAGLPAPPGDRGVFVSSLVAAGDEVYAVERRLRCETGCVALVRESAGRWEPRPAAGWPGTGELVAAGGRLVASGPSGTATSADGGASFTPVPGQGGLLAASGDEVAISAADGSAALLHVPTGRLGRAGPTGLRDARPAFGPARFAAGIDPATGAGMVARCDERFACGRGTVVTARDDLPRAYVSPDGTVFVTTVRGGFLRSLDGGRTFSPVTVVPPSPDGLVTTVQGVVFAPGAVVAGVLSVAGTPGDTGRLAGGVYVSRDRGATWRRAGGPSPLDGGVTALTRTAGGRILASWFAFPGSGGTLCLPDLDGRWAAACPAAPAGSRRPAPEGTSAGPAVQGRPPAAGRATPAPSPGAGTSPSRALARGRESGAPWTAATACCAAAVAAACARRRWRSRRA